MNTHTSLPHYAQPPKGAVPDAVQCLAQAGDARSLDAVSDVGLHATKLQPQTHRMTTFGSTISLLS